MLSCEYYTFFWRTHMVAVSHPSSFMTSVEQIFCKKSLTACFYNENEMNFKITFAFFQRTIEQLNPFLGNVSILSFLENSKNSMAVWKAELSHLFTLLNPFLAKVPILYLLKTLESQRFSGVFRGYKMETLVRND